MAFVDVPSPGYFFPAPPMAQPQNTTSVGTVSLTSAGHKIATVLRAPRSGTIRGFRFRPHVVTTGGDADCRLETVNSDGYPTGTLYNGTDSNVIKGLVSGDGQKFIYSGNFGGNATISTPGNGIAMVVENVTGSYTISHGQGTPWLLSGGIVSRFNTTGTWDRHPANFGLMIPEYVVDSVARYYDIGLWTPYDSISTYISCTSSGSFREAGNRFKMPFRCEVDAIVSHSDFTQNASGGLTLKLYDGDTLFTGGEATVEHNINSYKIASGGAPHWGTVIQPLSQRFTLEADTWYRVAAKATTTTALLQQKYEIQHADLKPATPGGVNCHLCTYNGTSWTDSDTTSYLQIGVRVVSIDIPSGGGGDAGSGSRFNRGLN